MLNPNDLNPISSLPYIYPKQRSHSSKRPLNYSNRGNPYSRDKVNGFFQNMIGLVNTEKYKSANARSTAANPRNFANEPYDPNQPLITSDIYIAKPLKFKSSLETVVEQIKSNLGQISGTYKEVITYKKPRLLPLIPVPEFKHKPKTYGASQTERDAAEISDDELLDWNGNMWKRGDKPPSLGSSSKLPTKKKTFVMPQMKKPSVAPKSGPYKSDMDLKNAYEEFRMAVKYIQFCNYLFRLLKHQKGDKMHKKFSTFLTENYPKALQEIEAVSWKLTKPQLIKTWTTIFTDTNINIVINKQLLVTYGMMDPAEKKKDYSSKERQNLIRDSQPFSDILHVSSWSHFRMSSKIS